MQRTIIGQDRLLNIIDLIDLDRIPHTLLINGLCEGAGEHLVASYVAEHLGLQSDEITDKLSAELIDDIYTKPEPIVYIIDTVKLSIKDQNVILKFIEEPLKNAYVILLCDNIYDLIPTVVNRCVVWSLECYTPAVLKSFMQEGESKQVLAIANTPGQVLAYADYDVEEMFKRADYIVSNMHRASFNNMIKLVGDVDFKGDDKDKFNITAWANVLECTISNKLMEARMIDDSANLTAALRSTIELSANIRKVGVDKQALYYQYLSKLWSALRGER